MKNLVSGIALGLFLFFVFSMLSTKPTEQPPAQETAQEQPAEPPQAREAEIPAPTPEPQVEASDTHPTEEKVREDEQFTQDLYELFGQYKVEEFDMIPASELEETKPKLQQCLDTCEAARNAIATTATGVGSSVHSGLQNGECACRFQVAVVSETLSAQMPPEQVSDFAAALTNILAQHNHLPEPKEETQE